jgi:hypothetical protein
VDFDNTIDDETFDSIQSAGDIVILMVQRVMVETLARQAREESREIGYHVSPGQVLDKAIKLYLETHGKPEAVDYLRLVSKTHGGG